MPSNKIQQNHSIKFDPQKEVNKLKRMYTLGIVISLGVIPAYIADYIAWNAAVFHYIKRVTYAHSNNPYLQYCEQQGIGPWDFLDQVMKYADQARARGEFDPRPIRIKIYLILIGIVLGLFLLVH